MRVCLYNKTSGKRPVITMKRQQQQILILLLLLSIFVSLGLSFSTTTKPIPITVLSGFLGSGKTSLLQNLLNNNQGLRIAVIVNDVASVNIDSKLVASTSSSGQQQQGGVAGAAPAGLVELANGCACCSLSEELLGSVSELVTLSDLRGESDAFDHIVIECSGVSDPKSIRAKFQEAVLYDMPLMERTRLDTMVTLVDCSVFLDHLKNSKSATPEESPELFYKDGVEPPKEDWEEDIPDALLEALMAGQKAYGGDFLGGGAEQDSGVADLLVSQCEIADIVLLNKVDLASRDDIELIEGIVEALNPRCTLYPTKFGEIPLEKVLAVAGGRGVVEAGVVDDHKDAVIAATVVDSSHSHSHHEHSRSHSHEHSSHDESHNCQDPDCTDPSHSHSHSHDHDTTNTVGMGTYVYRARRPFQAGRLLSFLRYLPVSRGLPPQSQSEDDSSEITISEACKTAMKSVLRSKGFAWFADSDLAAMYWSHAGTTVEVNCLGRWWATLPRENWPPEATKAILDDFDSANHNEEDPSFSTVGDRRQEIVFIGAGIGRPGSQEEISQALDRCLLDDQEWSLYCKLRSDEQSLKSNFPNPIQSKVLSY